jgi:hypothetical protein
MSHYDRLVLAIRYTVKHIRWWLYDRLVAYSHVLMREPLSI